MKKKIYAVMSSAALTTAISSAISTTAFAAVDGFLVNNNDKLFLYNYNELMEDSLNKLLGDSSPLYDEYIKGNLVAFHDTIKGYVNEKDVMDQSLESLMDGKNFDLDSFTESAKDEQIYKIEGKNVTERIFDEKKETVVDKKEKEAKAELKVESVSAINSTKVEVTFGKDSKVTDADLKDKNIKLTAGEKTFTATYRVGSLAEGKAAFDLSGKDTLVDATTYTITSDSFGFASDKLVAKIANAYAKTFEKVTTDVVANYNAEGVAQEAKADILFTAKNQYGEDIKADDKTVTNVKAVVKVNGMPLTKNEVKTGRDDKLALNSFADGKAKLEITKTLKENDTIEITLTKFDKAVDAADAKEIASSKVSYKVKKGEKAVATTVASVSAKYGETTIEGHKKGEVATEVLPTEPVTLTADVRDQYNNPISKVDNGNLVRWVVAEGKDLIDKVDVNNDLTSGTKDTQKNEISFKANKPGKLTIEAYNIANGSKATYSVTIGASKLTALTITDEKPKSTYNNEDVIYKKVAQDPAGANLTPEMIKFNVVAKTEGTTASDIAVIAKLRGGEDKAKAKDIVISAKTAKPGTYEITPYVGTAFDAKDAVKGNKVVVTTTLNKVAQKIEAITVPTVKVGTPQKVDLVVKNKHGEVIPVQAKDVKTAIYKDGKDITNDNIVTVGLVDKDGSPALGETAVKKLSFNATAKGDYVARISVAGTAANIDVAVKAEESSLKSIELGSPISGNTLIAGTAADKSVVKPIEVKDDKGDAIIPDIAGWTAVAKETDQGADARFASVTYYKLNDKGEIVTAGVNKAEAKGIAVKYDVHALADDKDKVYTVTVSNGQLADKEIKDTVEVTVKAARAVKEINVTPASSTIAVGGKQLVTIKPVDQYGDFIATEGMTIKSDNINIVDTAKGGDGSVTITPVDKDGKTLRAYNAEGVVGYTVALSGVKTGTAKVTVAKDAVTKAVDVTVAQASSVIDSIKIAGDKVDNDGKYKYVLGNNKDGDTEDKGETTQLSVKGFAGTSEVGVNPADVIWTMVSAKDSTGATIATVKNGKVTVTRAPKEDTTIIVKADLYGKTATISIPVVTDYEAASKLSSSSVKLKSAGAVTDLTKVDADATKEGIQLKIDGKTEDGEAADNTITLTFAGTDGFGETGNVTGKALSFNSDVVNVESNVNILRVIPVGAGSTTIRLTLDDGTNFAYDVQVTDEIGAKVKKAAIDKALKDVVKNDIVVNAADTRLTSLRELSSVSSDLDVNTILDANKTEYNKVLNNKTDVITTVSKVQEVVNEVNAEAVAVQAINEANADTIEKVVKDNAVTLGLDLTKYNKLVDKTSVKTALVGKSFADKTAVKTAFDRAVTAQDGVEKEAQKAAQEAAAVKAVNEANESTIEKVVTDNAATLGLDLTEYNKLADKASVKTALVSKDFQNKGAVKAAFDEAVKDQKEKEEANKAIEKAKQLLTDITLESEDNNLLTVLNKISGMKDTGVTLAVKSEAVGISEVATAKIAQQNGAITKGTSQQTVSVTITIKKAKGTDGEKTIQVTIPNA